MDGDMPGLGIWSQILWHDNNNCDKVASFSQLIDLFISFCSLGSWNLLQNFDNFAVFCWTIFRHFQLGRPFSQDEAIEAAFGETFLEEEGCARLIAFKNELFASLRR